jgi:SpoVK/Ycf46/Vps4 family AAA+-type ATPase
MDSFIEQVVSLIFQENDFSFSSLLSLCIVQLIPYLSLFFDYAYNFIYEQLYPEFFKCQIYSFDKTGRFNEIYLRIGVFLNSKLSNIKNVVCDDYLISSTEIIGIDEFENLKPELTIGNIDRLKFEFTNKGVDYTVYITKKDGKFFGKKLKESDTFSQTECEHLVLESDNKNAFANLIELSNNKYKESLDKTNETLYEYSLSDEQHYWNKNESIFKHRDKIILRKNDNNIFLPQKIEKKIKDIVHEFIHSEDKYKKFGIPYKLGIMIEGIPGTGKTSLTYYLSNILKRHIYRVNNSINSGDILKIKSSIPQNSIVLFDDVDMMDGLRNRLDTTKESNSKSNGVLHNLMKLMDAYNGLHGCIIIMTTNFINKLDDALIRPGRIDHVITLNKADLYQMKKIFKTFYNVDIPDDQLISYDKTFTTSTLINRIILSNLNDYNKAIGEFENEIIKQDERDRNEKERKKLEIEMQDKLDKEKQDHMLSNKIDFYDEEFE